MDQILIQFFSILPTGTLLGLLSWAFVALVITSLLDIINI